MKKKMNSAAILVILCLLGIGYLIPTVIMAVEDRSLQMEKKAIEIDEIQLSSQNVDTIEMLGFFPDMLMNYIVVDVGEGIQEDYMESVQSGSNEMEQNNSTSLQKNVQEFLLMLNAKEEIVFEKFYATNYAMMVEVNDDRVCSVWECVGVDAGENEYIFWVYDGTGKVMAFDVPYNVIGYMDEGFYSAMDRVMEYYEISDYGFPAYQYIDTQTNLYKTKYWQNGLLLLDKEGYEKLCIHIYKTGDRLLFNNYPGTVSISDGS
ncbi:MAG: hypothetical protein IJ455_01415 [Agathobacter sp.]|nr:hypothetical protein [Agathobacter sp.]